MVSRIHGAIFWFHRDQDSPGEVPRNCHFAMLSNTFMGQVPATGFPALEARHEPGGKNEQPGGGPELVWKTTNNYCRRWR